MIIKIQELLSLSQDLGINLLDTAPAYGCSEERLGEQLQKHHNSQRQDWVLATKVGEEFIGGESHFDFSAQHTQQSVERSLKRLQTDYIDIVLVHSNGDDLNIIQNMEVLASLEKLKQQGKILAYGVSTKTVEGGIAALQHSDLAMVTYNTSHTHERPIIDYAHEHNKGIFIKKAFASGHLCHNNSAINNSTQQSAASCLQFVFQHPGVHATIIGTINPKHLIENAQAMQQAMISLP